MELHTAQIALLGLQQHRNPDLRPFTSQPRNSIQTLEPAILFKLLGLKPRVCWKYEVWFDSQGLS